MIRGKLQICVNTKKLPKKFFNILKNFVGGIVGLTRICKYKGVEAFLYKIDCMLFRVFDP